MRPESRTAADLAKRAYAAFNGEDWATLQELLAPDVEFQRAGGMGTLHGSDTLIGFAEPDVFEWQRLEVLGEFIEHGDRILVALLGRARGRGSEIDLQQPVFHVATIRDGRITRVVVHFERAEALETLLGGD